MRPLDELPGDDQLKTLEERARRLATPLESGMPEGAAVELLHFAVAGERYALETALILRVVHVPQIRRVPGTPRAIAGVVSLHGEILPLVDLCALLDLARPAGEAPSRAIIIGRERAELGILAETTFGIESDPAGLLRDASAHRAENGVARAVLPGGISVLDTTALLTDPRLLIQDQSFSTGDDRHD